MQRVQGLIERDDENGITCIVNEVIAITIRSSESLLVVTFETRCNGDLLVCRDSRNQLASLCIRVDFREVGRGCFRGVAFCRWS